MTGLPRLSRAPDGAGSAHPAPPDDGPMDGDPAVDDPTQGDATEAETSDLAADFARELADARRAADANHDLYLRAVAEMHNIKRRGDERLQSLVEQQKRELLLRFLEVADNLARALANADGGHAALVTGVDVTLRELERLLAREGVERITADGEPFDPRLHEATGVVPVPGLEREQVVAVERAGYTVRGELLRPARVVVGQPPE